MGSFYATCSITKTTLTNQKSYLQLLVPSDVMIEKDKTGEYKWSNFTYSKQPEPRDSDSNHTPDHYIGFEKGLQVSNDGAIANYLPFGFPIKGEYDDYGQIDSYEKDKNIEMLEKFFNMDIESIMCAASRSGWKSEVQLENSMDDPDKRSWDVTAEELIGLDGTRIKNIYILEKLTCTFFRGEIYEFLCKGWNELKTTKGANNWDNPFATHYENIKKIHTPKPVEDRTAMLKMLGELYKKEDDGSITKEEKELLDVLMEDFSTTSASFSPRTYLSEYGSKADFIRMMPYTMEEFETDYKKQYTFLATLGWEMNYLLTPSQYGSQSANFKLVQDMNRYLDKLLTEDISNGWYEEDEDDYEEQVAERGDSLDEVLNDDDSKDFASGLIQTKFGRSDGNEFVSIKDVQKMVERAFMAGKTNVPELN